MSTPQPIGSVLQTLLHEGIRADRGGTTWFVDGSGLLASVRDLDAERASRSLSDGGATVAGHVEHVRWFLALLNAFARGERPAIDWSSSWTVHGVDEAEWRALLDDVAREADELKQHFAHDLDPQVEERLLPAVATVAHVAYHLGAVRQMIKVV